MGVGLVVGTDLRRGLSSWLRVALIIGVVAAVPLAAVAASARSDSVFARFAASNRTADLVVDVKMPRPDAIEKLRGVDGVRDVVPLGIVLGDAGGIRSTVDPHHASPDGRFGEAVDRHAILEGRRPTQSEPHEVLVNEAMADALDVGPGDTIRFQSWRPEQAAEVFGGGNPPMQGAALDLTVSGVGRGALDTGPSATAARLLFTKAFFDTYSSDVLAFQTLYMVVAADGVSFESVGEAIRAALGDVLVIDPDAHIGDVLEGAVGCRRRGDRLRAIRHACAPARHGDRGSRRT